MKEVTLTVTNDTGLHSRPADLFCRTAKLYSSKIHIFKGDKSSDAKNIIKVILLNVRTGSELRITADGEDEEQAISDLSNLITSDFTQVNERVKI
ncbi:MAG: HPr family phosphocarrier protein [Spirochaetales bacterium]|nr:HPr family phosphocarrier protein [Spirochaetales bacterium]